LVILHLATLILAPHRRHSQGNSSTQIRWPLSMVYLCMYIVYRIEVTYQKIDSKWHHDHGDQEIGDGQRDYKIIRDCLQRALAAHGQDDQDVAEEGQDGEQDQDERPVVVVH